MFRFNELMSTNRVSSKWPYFSKVCCGDLSFQFTPIFFTVMYYMNGMGWFLFVTLIGRRVGGPVSIWGK